MKAITLHQPWASFMAHGIKTIETRSWETLHRREIAIHAAATLPAYARRFCGERWVRALLENIGLNVETLPLGKVVAIGTLLKCWPTSMVFVNELERRLGDYSDGRFVWQFAKINRLYRPIPARGRQRIWNWDAPRIQAHEHVVSFRMQGY